MRIGHEQIKTHLENGYAVITREWRAGDVVELDFPMRVHEVVGNEKIAATRGQVAFERGPVVYCVEAVDQTIPTAPLAAPLHIATKEKAVTSDKAVTLQIEAGGAPAFTAIPYYAWNNRGLAPMTVWLPLAK